MSRARNLADLLDANGDVASGALDNVPPSNDASALTTGTLPIARIADGDITAAKLGSTLDLSGKTVSLPASNIGVGYIQSKMLNFRPTNGMVGDQTNVQVAIAGGGTGAIIDMGTPNSTSSVFHLTAQCLAHLDWATGTAADAGSYVGLSFRRKIGTGSWTVLYNHGNWGGGGANDNVDFNYRIQTFWRDRPNTTENVQYELCLNTHRGGADWGRIPTNSVGETSYLIVTEFDTGEAS
jgi:hypothetical protein